LALFLLALGALCVGMARPQHQTLVPRDRATVILVIDVSRSMEAKDVKPNRIGAAVAAVRTFLGRVPDRLQVGLIAFAGDPAGANLAKAAGIPVYTVALGTPNGSLTFGANGGYPGAGPFSDRRVPVPPDPETLKAIATRTGGQFFAAQSAKSLQSAYSKLGSSLGRKPGRSEITYVFLAVAALLLVAAGLLSALWSPRLPSAFTRSIST